MNNVFQFISNMIQITPKSKFLLAFFCFALISSHKLIAKYSERNVEANHFRVSVSSQEYNKENDEIPLDTVFNEKINLDSVDVSIARYVPKNFNLYQLMEADFNKDGFEDYFLLVGDTDRELFAERFDNIVDQNPMGIIILFGGQNNHYKKVVENLACFPSQNEDGGVYYAPELWIEVNKKNNISIQFSHGRYGYWQYLFRYQNNKFEMIGEEHHNSNGPITTSVVSINYSTRKKCTRTNTSEDEENEVWKEEWENIAISELKDLNTISFRE